MRWLARSLALCLVALAGCGDTTGSALVTFAAVAGGPLEGVGPFTTGLGYDVTLDRARLHVGAVYLNQTVPTSGAQGTSCVLPGVYVAEVFGPVDVDLLSPEVVPFPTAGEGTQTEAKAAEVWLTGGDIDALDDPTVIFDVAGTATRAGASYPFTASVSIGKNRAVPVQNPALPGAYPICRKRIVSPIPVDLVPTDGGTLELRVDPRGAFNGVDFAALEPTGGVYVVPDEAGGVGGALFKGLYSNAGVYAFAWKPPQQGEKQ